MSDRMQTQSDEFHSLESLTSQWRLLAGTAVVDDDYPSVRHVFESRLADFIDKMKANGRFERGNRYGLLVVGSEEKPIGDTKHPATVVAHWSTGPTAACEKHADGLVRLGKFLGLHVPLTKLEVPTECANCVNEAKDKS